MNIAIKHIHVGQAIEARRIELGISKSELGRRIGIPQQHVNRILERETMETNRLIKVSEVMDFNFNFFSLFCPVQHQISAYLAAVTLDGNANNVIGDSELSAQLMAAKAEIESLKATIQLMQQNEEMYKARIKDKESIIELLKERR